MPIALICVASACIAGRTLGAAPAQPPPPSHTITNGPYLQGPGQTVMTVMWETAAPAAGRLLYGTSPEYAWSFDEPEAVALHAIRLSALAPGTRYHYKVISTRGGDKAGTAEGTFVTAPAGSGSFSFAAYGDSRDNAVLHEALAAKVAAAAPALFVHVGDFVSDGKNSALWHRDFFVPAAALLRTAPLLPVLGNHENRAPQYFEYFAPPAVESGSRTEAWYSCDYGCAHIVAIDSQQDLRPTSAQYGWLRRDLASERAAAAAWRIVALHGPVYSSSLHGGDASLQKHLVPLCETYRVSLVLSGHDHAYVRSTKNGVTYIVTGGGGAPLYPVNQTANPFQAYAATAYHYLIFTASDTGLHGEAYDVAGTPFDSFTIEPPPAR